MKGQTAFEFMIIAIFVLAFMMPLWFYVAQVQSQTSDQITLSYAKNAAVQIAKRADLVYSQRMDASIKIEIYIPAGVEYINIEGNEVVMHVNSISGDTDVYSTSIAQMQGELPAAEGLYWVMIKAQGDYVNISLA